MAQFSVRGLAKPSLRLFLPQKRQELLKDIQNNEPQYSFDLLQGAVAGWDNELLMISRVFSLLLTKFKIFAFSFHFIAFNFQSLYLDQIFPLRFCFRVSLFLIGHYPLTNIQHVKE